jgi:hypothetical protein
VQGQLTKKRISFVIRTECAGSGDPIVIDIDSDLRYRVADEHRGVRIFVPMVDVMKLKEPSIIDSF